MRHLVFNPAVYYFIASGNMLLSMIDKGCDGELTSQLMLRYGFISPVISGHH